MGYVLVNKKTQVRHPSMPSRGGYYKTASAAQAALTRAIHSKQQSKGEYEVMEASTYHEQVPMREVVNLMTGKTVLERADTPWGCSVASESYWSS